MIIPLSQYPQVLRNRMITMIKNGEATEIDVATIMAATARRLAPLKTGKLRKGIVRRKNIVKVSANNNGFPYVHWVNQTYGSGLATLRVKKKANGKNTVWINGRPVNVQGGLMRYGSRPSNWRWTGTAGFFRIARDEARAMFPFKVKQDVTRKALTQTV